MSASQHQPPQLGDQQQDFEQSGVG